MACLALSPAALQAHEFWIDPTDFLVAPGDPIIADLRVGENFNGAAQVYLSHQTRRFDLGRDGDLREVEARMGDRPALNMIVDDEGLVTVVHVTGDNALTYRGMEKFENFVRHKDAEWTIQAHKEAGLPTDRFVEVYSRYAKSLIAVGDGAGKDREFGLETEIVALSNPYTDDLSQGMRVELKYLGEPRRDAQIEVFEKAGDEITVATVRTDGAGRATIPVTPGARYMLDAVVLRSPLPEVAEARGAVWESLWANLTFAVPE